MTPPHATTPSAAAPNRRAERSSFPRLVSVRALPAYCPRLLPSSSATRRSLHSRGEGREGGNTGEEERGKEGARGLCSCVWNVNVGKARWIYVIYGESVPSQPPETRLVRNQSGTQRSSGRFRQKEKHPGFCIKIYLSGFFDGGTPLQQ